MINITQTEKKKIIDDFIVRKWCSSVFGNINQAVALTESQLHAAQNFLFSKLQLDHTGNCHCNLFFNF